MPKVVCSHCGEELMGSVNRCWRCGRTFVAEHNPENLPPIRRRPIPLELVNKSLAELAQAAVAPVSRAVGEAESAAPVLAQVAEATISEPADQAEPAGAASEPGKSPPTPPSEHHHPPEPHSEVAPVASVAVPAAVPRPPAKPATPFYAPAALPRYPANAGATGGAIATVVLGVMALATIKFITPGALLISILGVGMGVWGLYSDRRPVAVFGLLLCCIAMALSGFLSAVQLFELINGYNPFEPDLPVEDPTVM